MKLTNRKKKTLSFMIAALCAVSTGFAATDHWADASLTPQQVTRTIVGEDTDWQSWKDNWGQIRTNYEQVAIAPGTDATHLNFAWYSKQGTEKSRIRIAENPTMRDAREFEGSCQTGTVINGMMYYANKVEASGLKAKKNYWYQVNLDGQWQQVQPFKTGEPEDFSFMFVGDPQIGASTGAGLTDGTKQDAQMATRNDAYNWNKTLNKALSQHADINFLVSPGDQINEPAADQKPEKLALQEEQYDGYLSAAALRSLPQATSIGNHDSMTASYMNHFNVPNPFLEETNPTKAGHGYYYSYGKALFIVINANNYNAADHKALIEKAIAANPKAKWRIVVMHQDIYGSGLDHSDSDGILLRTQLTPIYDANHIDVVLQGHDHTYARTYQISSDSKQHGDFAEYETPGQQGQHHDVLDQALLDPNKKAAFLSQNLCYTIADMRQGKLVNPKGVFYMSANSATGSKFYNLIPQQQDYIAARSQTWRPTYSVIRVTGNQLTITTYDVETGTAIDDPYSIIKE